MLLPDGGVQLEPVDDDLADLLGFSNIQDKRSSAHNEEEFLHLVFRPEKRLSVPDGKFCKE